MNIIFLKYWLLEFINNWQIVIKNMHTNASMLTKCKSVKFPSLYGFVKIIIAIITQLSKKAGEIDFMNNCLIGLFF